MTSGNRQVGEGLSFPQPSFCEWLRSSLGFTVSWERARGEGGGNRVFTLPCAFLLLSANVDVRWCVVVCRTLWGPSFPRARSEENPGTAVAADKAREIPDAGAIRGPSMYTWLDNLTRKVPLPALGTRAPYTTR